MYLGEICGHTPPGGNHTIQQLLSVIYPALSCKKTYACYLRRPAVCKQNSW
uniref:Uncharacterized protein n=1 Tax=Arion vulgaris TaxID=1028688 RepID=A0A0B6YVA6_9EUPU